MSLDKQDIEVIERLIYKNADDIAVSISRSFERLEERLDSSESRLCARVAELDDRVEGIRQEMFDEMSELKEEMRDAVRIRE